MWFVIDIFIPCFLGDKYINGEIIPCTYPTYQPKQRGQSKYESRRYERRRNGPPPMRKPRQEAPQSESPSQWGIQLFITTCHAYLSYKFYGCFVATILYHVSLAVSHY